MFFLKGIVQVICEHFLLYEVKELLYFNLRAFLQKDIIQSIRHHDDDDDDDRDDEVRDHDVYDCDVHTHYAHDVLFHLFLFNLVSFPLYDDDYAHVHDVHEYGHDVHEYGHQYECDVFHVLFVKLNSFIQYAI